MSLAGSGNKGITASVPVVLWGRHLGAPQERIDEALALACIVTSGVTHRLGSLSAMCGAAIAGGIGVAAALVLLEGGGAAEVSAAATNIVGNLAGMICDGAKIGCALKTMTGVDAAFRAASLARAGLVIPVSDGIVGADGLASLGQPRPPGGGRHGGDGGRDPRHHAGQARRPPRFAGLSGRGPAGAVVALTHHAGDQDGRPPERRSRRQEAPARDGRGLRFRADLSQRFGSFASSTATAFSSCWSRPAATSAGSLATM